MDKLKLALISLNITWQDPITNLEKLTTCLNNLPKVDLIVLPEMFTTGFSMTPAQIANKQKETLDWMRAQAQKNDCGICGSIIYQDTAGFYNRFLGVSPNGIYTYDKKHLFSYAKEEKSYLPGSSRQDWMLKNWRIRPIICYDLRFPVWCRNDSDYDLLLCIANWPKARIDAWKSLLKARAIENMSYTIGVNRTGIDPMGNNYPNSSYTFDCTGQEVVKKEPSEVQIIVLDKESQQRSRKRFGFLNDRDTFKLQ